MVLVLSGPDGRLPKPEVNIFTWFLWNVYIIRKENYLLKKKNITKPSILNTRVSITFENVFNLLHYLKCSGIWLKTLDVTNK